MSFRIFVGTMYCGENEFEWCKAAINAQKDVEIIHHIVADKRELEACIDLYGTWNSVKGDFDAFIQVDADTIVEHDRLFYESLVLLQDKMSEVCKISNIVYASDDALTVCNNMNYTSIQYHLDDFFTGKPINGLNVYSPKVIFNIPKDELYCERIRSNNVFFTPEDSGGKHAPDPSLRQAFHFGLHRGLKRRTVERSRVENTFKQTKDDRHLMAIKGFDAAKEYPKGKHCYGDVEFEKAFTVALSAVSKQC